MRMTLSRRQKWQQNMLIVCIALSLLLLILLHYRQYLLLRQLAQVDNLNFVWSFARLDIAMIVFTVMLLSLMATMAFIAYHNMQIAQARRELAELLNESLTRALQDAQAGNRSKTLFLANMSHEIRTPLNGLLGITESLLQSPLQPQQKASLQLIKSSAQALLMMITDILDFSRLDSGKLSLSKQAFPLRTLLTEILYPFNLRATQKGVHLHWQIAESIRDQVYSDPFRLRQILNNLLDNALKFTNQGKVTLTVTEQEDKEIGPVLLFAVMDTGVGIAQQQSMIFDPFMQADSTISHHYGGTGLGLAITRALVVLLGGQIWLESEPDRGTTFYFTLPLEQEPVRTAIEKSKSSIGESFPQAHNRAPLQLLLVEDNLLNQIWAQILLQQQGHQVTIASSGEAALQLLVHQQFDLILMDVQMPGRDGLAVTKEIRDKEQQNGGYTPIIAMTAHVLQGDRERCLAAGMDGYISKPIDNAQLEKEMHRVLHARDKTSH